MKLAFAFLADYAMAAPDGKINVIGAGIDRFTVPIPTLIAQVALVFRVAFDEGDFGRRLQVAIRPVGPDGEVIGGPPQSFEVVPQRHPGAGPDPTYGNVVVTMQGFPIAAAGLYRWELVVGSDQIIGSVSVRAVDTPLPASPA